MTQYLIAHDIGTSGNKATLFTIEGVLEASTTYPYGTNFFNDTWAEQNPADWWKAVCQTTKQLISGIDASMVKAVSFSGQMMGCLCVDRKGKPLRDSIIYCDQRGLKEAERIAEKIPLMDFYRICGHRISSVYSLEKLMWIKANQPEVYENTYKVLNAKDYVVFKLTGKFATDRSDASGMNAYDIVKKEWSGRILDAAGIDGDMLPPIHNSTDVIGEVTSGAAKETNLQEGTPVVMGAGDGSAAGVGAGCIRPGTGYTYLGSSSWLATTTEKPFRDEKMRTMTWAHAVPDLYHPSGSMQAAGTCYQWLKNEICKLETKKSEAIGISPYELIDQKIEESQAGAGGLLFLPYLLGERSPHWNPNAKGVFMGIKLSTKREDLMRSVLEGISFNLKSIYEIFQSKIDIKDMILIGGGAKGKVWRQIFADIYDAEILVPNYLEEATSIGAAVIGGVGACLLEDFEDIKRFIQITDRVTPLKENTKIYRKSYQLFLETYIALVDVFNKM